MTSNPAIIPANDHQLGSHTPILQLLMLAATYLPSTESMGTDTASELNLHLTCAIIAAMRLNLESKNEREPDQRAP